MGKNKVLVKVHPEGKYVVDIDKNIDITKITPSTMVALCNDSYVLHLVLPRKVDPLVNLMKVEKVPDSYQPYGLGLLLITLTVLASGSGFELVQKYIGEGSRMVRELFVMARSYGIECLPEEVDYTNAINDHEEADNTGANNEYADNQENLVEVPEPRAGMCFDTIDETFKYYKSYGKEIYSLKQENLSQ